MTDLILLSRVEFRGTRVTGARVAGLLALLASDLRAGCGMSRLVDGLWPDKQPQHPANALYVVVSRARALLGADSIVSTSTGYRLTLAETQVDAAAVVLSASAASQQSRAGDHAAALTHANAGLALWDKAPSAELSDDPVAALRAERAMTYHSLVRTRALSLARLGRHAEAAPELTALVAERPRDEELLLELLRCEHATIGPSAALTRYEEYRKALRDELGADPGPALTALHQQILQGRSPVARYGVLQDPNPLLGRADDIAAVSALVRSSRVTSIVGPGGLGKTRLAHVVSRRAEQRIVHFVSLAGISAGVALEVESALETSDIAATLRGALLVLDNCEHVLDEAAELVATLISRSEDARVLTTSRTPLGLSSEAVYLLPELDLATSVELFTQRALAARSSVTLPDEAVEQLCGKLDGLPLALELAAARVRTMSVEEIADLLPDRFTVLRGRTRDSPERHHTLRAVVEWSWQLLDPVGQAALPVLSVFPGGFTAAAARHVLESDDALECLVGHSLLKVVETPSGTRFRMLETVREFGAQRRGPAAIDRFLAWARDFGRAHFASYGGSDPFRAADRIRSEQDNLLHAMRIGMARNDGPTVTATGAVLAALWTVDSNYVRMHALTNDTAWTLSHYWPEPEFVEVTRMVALACTMNSFAVVGPRPSRSLRALRRLPAEPVGDSPVRAAALVLAAAPEYWSDDQAALKVLCDDPNALVAGFANAVASYAYRAANHIEAAAAAMDRAVECFAGGDHPFLRITALQIAAGLAYHVGMLTRARAYVLQALPLLEQHGGWFCAAQLHWGMAQVSLHLGETDEAERWLALSGLDKGDGAVGELLPVLGVRAEIALARGEIDAGLRQWRAALHQLKTRPTRTFRLGAPGAEPWVLEQKAVAVVAHARHGRLDLVADIAAELPGKLRMLLTSSSAALTPYVVDYAVIAALLIALATADGRQLPRMIALAQRFHYLGGVQPTMTVTGVREMAERADKVAYEKAVAEYADLRTVDLRPAAMALLKALERDSS